MIESLALSNFMKSEQVSENCVLVRFGGGTEESRQLIYTVFPGINVLYQTLHTDGCRANFSYADQVITVDYCQQGRIEWEHENENFCYLGEQDMQISARPGFVGACGFPTRHYHGITAAIQIEEAQRGLMAMQDYFPLKLEQIYQKLENRKREITLRADQGTEQLFSRLIADCEKGDLMGMRLRVLELLVLLADQADDLPAGQERPYFPKNVVEKVRAIKEELCRDMNSRQTLAEVAAKYEISETMLKRCFHVMYGNSVYAFIKDYRLQAAAKDLATTDRPVMEVALEVGYENPSKFSAAFRKRYGVTPKEFRARHRSRILAD